MDISDMTTTEINKVWFGLTHKVDFEKWEAVDSATKRPAQGVLDLRSVS